MLIHELRKIQRDIEKSAARNAAAPETHKVLQDSNSSIRARFSEATHQLEEWKKQLDARQDLQRLLIDALPADETTRLMWWQEQTCFYEGLTRQIQAYFSEDSEGFLSLSLTALELLFMVRLGVETGIVKADSLQTIFKSLSKYIGTESYGMLSYESLKKRYSMRHDGTRKKVKQILMDMIRRIDQGPTRGG